MVREVNENVSTDTGYWTVVNIGQHPKTPPEKNALVLEVPLLQKWYTPRSQERTVAWLPLWLMTKQSDQRVHLQQRIMAWYGSWCAWDTPHGRPTIGPIFLDQDEDDDVPVRALVREWHPLHNPLRAESGEKTPSRKRRETRCRDPSQSQAKTKIHDHGGNEIDRGLAIDMEQTAQNWEPEAKLKSR